MSRPPKKIDENILAHLAQIDCTQDEMCAVLGCSHDTLQRRYSGFIKENRCKGNVSLRRKQSEVAIKDGNVKMLMWLGIQRLGQTNKMETKNENLNKFNSMSEGELLAAIENINRRLGAANAGA